MILIALIAGCTSEQKQEPVTEIRVYNHIYTFSNDIREANRVKIIGGPETEARIIQLIYNADLVDIIYNGSSSDDNSYFAVVSYNLVSKIVQFFAYEGKLIDFKGYTFENATFQNPKIILRGPNTGAKETSISMIDNMTIVLQGTNYGNLTLAGDKLVLTVFKPLLREPLPS